MTPLPLVYLGPSLPRAAAEELLAADYRPPIRRGDLLHVDPCSTVVVIDGEFGQNLSVSPKEILRLLDAGAVVWGASSMGALRAAELDRMGMRGVGWVYHAYRSGRIRADDEVALTFSPWNFEALTIPLVHVRFWAGELRRRRIIVPAMARAVVRAAAAIFFADRTPRRLRDVLGALPGAAVEQWLSVVPWEQSDIKAFDARRALELVREDIGANDGNEESDLDEEDLGKEGLGKEGEREPGRYQEGRAAQTSRFARRQEARQSRSSEQRAQ